MDELAIGPLVMGIVGGLSIFLYGLEQVTGGLKALGGAGMSTVLRKLTKNRFLAVLSGGVVTAMIQSSTVTTVLVVGFVSAGLMTLEQAIGVIMGANVGSTVTAQIVAFNVYAYSLWLIAAGYLVMALLRRRAWSRYGAIVMGLGMMFLGLGLMSESTEPLRTFPPFIDFLGHIHNPLFAILVGAVITMMLSSSGAAMGIVVMLASRGFITLETGIAVSFGANIGTCLPAMLAAMGKSRESVQAAGVHLLFNVLGVLIWLPLIHVLADLAVAISPSRPDLDHAARMAAEVPRQIANAHTLFNVLNTMIFIWFAGLIARLMNKIVPRSLAKPDESLPVYLQQAYLDTPDMAFDALRQEIARLGRRTIEYAEASVPVFLKGTRAAIKAQAQKSRANQHLYEEICRYIRTLSTSDLVPHHSRRLAALTAVASYVQNVGETFSVNMTAIALERERRRVTPGPETLKVLAGLAREVRDAFAVSLDALGDPPLAQRVIEMKPRIARLAEQTQDHLSRRLVSSDPHRSVLYRLETHVVEVLQREYYFAKKIGKEIIRRDNESGEDTLTQAEMSDDTNGNGGGGSNGAGASTDSNGDPGGWAEPPPPDDQDATDARDGA